MRGRQVLSLFGYDEFGIAMDPAPNGMLVFDMTTMQWKDSYDANAGPYKRPDDLNTWYSNGSFDKVNWSSNQVRQLFARKSTTTPSSSQNPGSSPTSTSTSSDSPGADAGSAGETQSTSTPVGAIAGGVVGGVAGVALIGATVWFALRRRKQRTLAGSVQEDNTDETGEIKHPGVPEADAPHGHAEVTSYRPAAEMDPRDLPVEVDPQNRYEMEHQMRYEMEPQTRYELGHEVYYEMDPQTGAYYQANPHARGHL